MTVKWFAIPEMFPSAGSLATPSRGAPEIFRGADVARILGVGAPDSRDRERVAETLDTH